MLWGEEACARVVSPIVGPGDDAHPHPGDIAHTTTNDGGPGRRCSAMKPLRAPRCQGDPAPGRAVRRALRRGGGRLTRPWCPSPPLRSLRRVPTLVEAQMSSLGCSPGGTGRRRRRRLDVAASRSCDVADPARAKTEANRKAMPRDADKDYPQKLQRAGKWLETWRVKRDVASHRVVWMRVRRSGPDSHDIRGGCAV